VFQLSPESLQPAARLSCALEIRVLLADLSDLLQKLRRSLQRKLGNARGYGPFRHGSFAAQCGHRTILNT
jgi:hypothetical protein